MSIHEVKLIRAKCVTDCSPWYTVDHGQELDKLYEGLTDMPNTQNENSTFGGPPDRQAVWFCGRSFLRALHYYFGAKEIGRFAKHEDYPTHITAKVANHPFKGAKRLTATSVGDFFVKGGTILDFSSGLRRTLRQLFNIYHIHADDQFYAKVIVHENEEENDAVESVRDSGAAPLDRVDESAGRANDNRLTGRTTSGGQHGCL